LEKNQLPHIQHLECLICGKQYQTDEVEYVCPDHGFEGILDVVYDYGYIKQQLSVDGLRQNKEQSIWRYQALLPIPTNSPLPLLRVGGTPLYKVDLLAKSLGLKNLWIKDDGQNPTASLKDRAAAIAIVKAQLKGAEVITTASTGNAAAALSGLCAGIGQRNVIFVPKSAPPAKIAQLLVCGSEVRLVRGSYDDAFELCLHVCQEEGWYNRNTAYNPYMTEGKKTVSFEIFEQLGYQAPDAIFVSVGDGCIIGGVHKGFKDLYQMGWIDKIPRLYGVQAAGSNYLAEAWENNEDVISKAPIKAQTLADSISAGLPRDRIKAMKAVKETNGAYITVSDEAILQSIPLLAQKTGVFAEPAGAAAHTGLLVALEKKWVDKDEKIVILNTGNGLKDLKGAQRSIDLAGLSALEVDPL
jgi:threonine synthase